MCWTHRALGSGPRPAPPGPGHSQPPPPSSLPPHLVPPHPCAIFQVIIIQPQVQAQPEGTAEARPPTEAPSQGAQATKKRKEDRPPSQENPEVGRPQGLAPVQGTEDPVLQQALRAGPGSPPSGLTGSLAEGQCGTTARLEPDWLDLCPSVASVRRRAGRRGRSRLILSLQWEMQVPPPGRTVGRRHDRARALGGSAPPPARRGPPVPLCPATPALSTRRGQRCSGQHVAPKQPWIFCQAPPPPWHLLGASTGS